MNFNKVVLNIQLGYGINSSQFDFFKVSFKSVITSDFALIQGIDTQ